MGWIIWGHVFCITENYLCLGQALFQGSWDSTDFSRLKFSVDLMNLLYLISSWGSSGSVLSPLHLVNPMEEQLFIMLSLFSQCFIIWVPIPKPIQFLPIQYSTIDFWFWITPDSVWVHGNFGDHVVEGIKGKPVVCKEFALVLWALSLSDTTFGS